MRIAPVLGVYALFLLACSGDGCKKVTSTVVGKTVETTKGVTKGVAEGIQEGRQSGESIDGARIVYNQADLSGHGTVAVFSVEPVEGVEGQTRIALAVENTGDQPLRLSEPAVLVLDQDDFAHHPTDVALTLTVPAHAKDRLNFTVDVAPDKVKTVRLWDQDLQMPAGGASQP